MKVLLNSFHLNDHTRGFHPQTHNWVQSTFIDSRFDSGSESVKATVIPERELLM